jgi:phytochelatin synthase
MNLQRAFRRTYLYIVYGAYKIAGAGPFGPNRAEYVHDPVCTQGNPLKTALFKHHVKQFHGASCSVASVVSIINALKDLQPGGTAPISQMDILEKVKTANWKERMIDKDYRGRRGLPLSVLGDVVESSLNAYKIGYQAIETVQAAKDPGRSERIRKVLWNMLRDFEERGDCLIIAHFDQGAYVPTLNIPHISPVGGFDRETGKVLILDVDPEEERHYKIGFDTFYRGLSSNCHRLRQSTGFGRGGYVFVKLS